MHQGGQSSNPDPLAKPEAFRSWMDAEYGVNLSSVAWGRDWEPFVQQVAVGKILITVK